MARLIRTGVDVTVVFRQQIDVVEEITLVVTPSARLCEADVEQHTAVETAARRLKPSEITGVKLTCKSP